MRIVHKGYAATTYGKNNMTVSDREGRVIYEDRSREADSYTEMELKLLIEAIHGERTTTKKVGGVQAGV